MRLFNSSEFDCEGNFFSGQFLRRIFCRECERESFFTDSHALDSIFKSREHLTCAENELVVVSLTAFENFTVKFAFEINCNQVVILGRSFHLGVSCTLFAHYVQCLVYVFFSKSTFEFSNLNAFEVRHLNFRENFESNFELNKAFFVLLFSRIDRGLADNFKLAFLQSFRSCINSQLVDSFLFSFETISGGNHAHRSFAWTETMKFCLLGILLQALLNFFFDISARNGDFNLSFKRIRFNFNCFFFGRFSNCGFSFNFFSGWSCFNLIFCFCHFLFFLSTRKSRAVQIKIFFSINKEA